MKRVRLLSKNINKLSLLAILISLMLLSANVNAQSGIKGCESPCNLIKNGDFSLGATGFTSALPQLCNSCTAGSWCVGPTFKSKCSSWPNTGGNPGAFLSIDGSENADNVDVWAKKVTLCQGVTYTFSFDVRNVYPDTFDIGAFFDSSSKLTAAVNLSTGWKTITVSGITGAGVHTISIRQLTKGAKRDFGIDNVFFGFCSCECKPN